VTINLLTPAHYVAYVNRIRQAHPDTISFINPPVFEKPPDLSEHVEHGKMALSSHFYDGMTLLGKRRHLYNAVRDISNKAESRTLWAFSEVCKPCCKH
jgi:hypothetical protein